MLGCPQGAATALMRVSNYSNKVAASEQTVSEGRTRDNSLLMHTLMLRLEICKAHVLNLFTRHCQIPWSTNISKWKQVYLDGKALTIYQSWDHYQNNSEIINRFFLTVMLAIFFLIHIVDFFFFYFSILCTFFDFFL